MADGANNRGSNSMGNNRTSNGMGNNWTSNGMGNNRTGNSMSNRGGNNIREDSLAVIGDLGDVAFSIVGSVVDMLDTAIRKVDRVASLPGSGAIIRLLGVKTGSRVVVSHGILVGVGGDLVGVDLSNGMGNWVSNGVTNNSMSDAVTNNAMADADTMTNNTVADAHAMSNGVSHRSNYRGGHCMGGNSMAHSSNKAMANPDPTDSVSDGMGWGGCSNGGGASNPG